MRIISQQIILARLLWIIIFQSTGQQEMKPTEGNKVNEETYQKWSPGFISKLKFKVHVRADIANKKYTFSSKYKNTQSKQIFVTNQINNTACIMYKIKYLNEEEVTGSFTSVN